MEQARMPRLPRLHIPGGYYHVMLRGNHRENLFTTPYDRDVLNDVVGLALIYPLFTSSSNTTAHCRWLTIGPVDPTRDLEHPSVRDPQLDMSGR